MYPPLDATSNTAGGKGPSGFHGTAVGRKWEGSDVPASVLEAGEIFSRRVRMSRATRQLWDETERFKKYERGWDEDEANPDITEELDLSELTLEERKMIQEAMKEDRAEIATEEEMKEDRKIKQKSQEKEVDYGPGEVSDTIKRRLDALDAFYVSCPRPWVCYCHVCLLTESRESHYRTFNHWLLSC